MRPASSLVEITACSRSSAGELVLRDHAAPDPAAQVVDRAQRLGLEQDLAAVDDRHPRAQLAHVLDDVRGEEDDAVLAQLGEQVEEAHALGRVEAGRRLVDDHQLRIAQQRDGDAEALAHAARVAAELLLAHVPQVRLPQQRLDDLLARAALGDALEQREVIEQVLRARPSDRRRTPAAGSRASCARRPSACSTSMSPRRMLPASGSCSVARMRISVDLPAPFGPSRPYMPAGMVRVTSFSACTPLG